MIKSYFRNWIWVWCPKLNGNIGREPKVLLLYRKRSDFDLFPSIHHHWHYVALPFYNSSLSKLAFDLLKKMAYSKRQDKWVEKEKRWKSPAVFIYPPTPGPPLQFFLLFFLKLSVSSFSPILALSCRAALVSHHSHGKSCQSKFGERKWRPCSLPKPPNLFPFLHFLCVCVCVFQVSACVCVCVGGAVVEQQLFVACPFITFTSVLYFPCVSQLLSHKTWNREVRFTFFTLKT